MPRIARPAANLTAAVLSGTVLIGNTLTVTPGTWSRPTSLLYSLMRDDVPILRKVSSAEIEAYPLVFQDIGPPLILVTHSLAGGGYSESAPVYYDDAAHLPATAIWDSKEGVTQAGTVSAWASSYGGLAVTLTAAGAPNQPLYDATGGIGGRPLITFDGTDDALEGTITKGSAWNDYEQGWIGKRAAFDTISEPILGFLNAGTYRWSFADRTTTTVRFNVNGGANQDYTITNGTTIHLGGRSVGGTQTLDVNGVEVVTGAGTTTSRADPGTVRMGSTTACPLVSFQNAYMSANLTSDQRLHLRALLTYLSGHTA